jgi:hypothetical protein
MPDHSLPVFIVGAREKGKQESWLVLRPGIKAWSENYLFLGAMHASDRIRGRGRPRHTRSGVVKSTITHYHSILIYGTGR